MNQTEHPARFPIPFANSADSAHVRDIPVPSQTPTTTDAPASLTDGFPDLTFLPEASGGIPPNGRDFNGILRQITAGLRWLQAGGRALFNGDFASAIGGYPKGALLGSAATAGKAFVSTADGNTNDPDSNTTGWASLPAIITNDLSSNGKRIWADGLKECWGRVTVPANGFITVPLPDHSSYLHPTLGPFVKNTSQAQFNTGLTGVTVGAGSTSFTLANWENVALDVCYRTTGV